MTELVTSLVGTKVRVHVQPIGEEFGHIRSVYIVEGYSAPMYTIEMKFGKLIEKTAHDFAIEL